MIQNHVTLIHEIQLNVTSYTNKYNARLPEHFSLGIKEYNFNNSHNNKICKYFNYISSKKNRYARRNL